MSTKRDHRGIAHHEGQRHPGPGHAPEPTSPDPRRATCATCGRALHFTRRTYGPNGRAAHWQHTGDGLTQYRSWR